LKEKLARQRGRRASLHMEAVEGTGNAPLHATNELNLKQVLVNNDQFPYFFSLRACGNFFAEPNASFPL